MVNRQTLKVLKIKIRILQHVVDPLRKTLINKREVPAQTDPSPILFQAKKVELKLPNNHP